MGDILTHLHLNRYHVWVVVLVLLMLAKPVWAQNTAVQGAAVTDRMALGNQLYESGRFVEAAQAYQQLVDQGLRDAALFYNLGNAYYRSDDLGQAVLNYERAIRLAPRDADVRYNLNIARSQVVDQFDTTNTATAIARFTIFARSWLTVNEMAKLLLALWLGLFALLLGIGYGRSSRVRQVLRGVVVVTAVLWLGGLVSLGSRLYLERTRPEVVILTDSVPVMSSPSLQAGSTQGAAGTAEFTLHAGAKVNLVEARGDWIRLTLPGDQLQGWVPSDTVAAISN